MREQTRKRQLETEEIGKKDKKPKKEQEIDKSITAPLTEPQEKRLQGAHDKLQEKSLELGTAITVAGGSDLEGKVPDLFLKHAESTRAKVNDLTGTMVKSK